MKDAVFSYARSAAYRSFKSDYGISPTRKHKRISNYMMNDLRVILLLIMVFGVYWNSTSSFAIETRIPTISQTSVTRDSDGKSDDNDHTEDGKIPATETWGNLCSGCSSANVVIVNRIFTAGTDCLCVGTESITIGEGVVIEKGARVIFEAPKVNIQSGFKAERGSIFIIQWDDPPPPPG